MADTAFKLAALRASLDQAARDNGHANPLVPLGHGAADACLKGGLRQGTVHEVFAAEAGHAATATGFALTLAARMAGKTRWLLWVRQDFAALEEGEPYGAGLVELGLDPSRILMVRAADAAGVLRATAEGLATASLGAVVLEPWGEPKLFDLVTSRRLALAAARTNVTAILLRPGAEPWPSAAETRWLIRAARSRDGQDDWGTPVFDASLVRNRHGTTGQWVMEWNCDDRLFRQAAHPRVVAAASADGPAPAARAAFGR
ncbi:MAG: DNA repair protein [Rhizomicrobium sp.]|jgi:protein ImuA